MAAMRPDVQPDGREQKKRQDGGDDLHAPDLSRRAPPDGQARQQHLKRKFLHRLALRRQAGPRRTQPRDIICVEMTRGLDLDQVKDAEALHFRRKFQRRQLKSPRIQIGPSAMPDGSATAHIYRPKLATVLAEGYNLDGLRPRPARGFDGCDRVAAAIDGDRRRLGRIARAGIICRRHRRLFSLGAGEAAAIRSADRPARSSSWWPRP
jgi:hypothetical protein